jgi:hypothetical protein
MQFPIGHFYDHGTPHPNDRIVSRQFLAAYEMLATGKRTIVKPGDKMVLPAATATNCLPSTAELIGDAAGVVRVWKCHSQLADLDHRHGVRAEVLEAADDDAA